MDKVITALEKNGFAAKYFENAEDAKINLLKEIDKNESVGIGGSMTVLDMGIYDDLVVRGNDTYWHWKAEDKKSALENAVNTEVYLTSSNAVTEDGKLVNKDGTGNRVASMIYGHKRVYVIVGKNKVTKNVEEAFKRIETVAAPLNAKRLNLTTPCVYTGVCSDCDSKDRICKAETILSKNPNGTKIYVYIINEDMGY
ncbi:lactate utilization protein [Gudongella sp. DL1XJH-153]|uniref:lactate utilization protein n=1 Tax=Gudongella sp. DL1XJH-153 TaxID=3409804 RepID=UPI003BB66170